MTPRKGQRVRIVIEGEWRPDPLSTSENSGMIRVVNPYNRREAENVPIPWWIEPEPIESKVERP